MLSRALKETAKYNIRYVGFESLTDGARRLDYAITSQGAAPRYASMHIPATAFSGAGRVSFQDSSTICYEKLRRELEILSEMQDSLRITLTTEDIERFRPRRRAAWKRP